MIWKTIFTILSLMFGLAVFLPYYINIWKKTARPHLFSWLIWAILTGVGFILSFNNGGGQGSWIFGIHSILNFGVVIYAFFYGEKNITKADWIAFICALIIFIFYLLTKNALISVILAVSIDGLGFLPTFRKSYKKPYDEPILTYVFAVFGFLFSIFVLENYTFITILYPLMLVIVSAILAIFLFLRRRAIMKNLQN